MKNEIFVKGARENNLKNIDVRIPRDKFVVFTGLSGSGKSSLAFDTIYAEGQRRYVESLSSYARQFLGQMDKPDVDYIEGLSPSISIDQKTTSKNPRSTVGTVTEVYDYFRLFFARIGVPHCPQCGKIISQQTIDQIADKVMAYPTGSKISIMAPVVRGRKGEYNKLIDSFKRSGYVRIKVDGAVFSLEEEIMLDKNIRHSISVVIDRLIIKEGIEHRLVDSLETALKLAEGLVAIDNDGEENLFSTKYACPDCDVSIEELTPRLFSFNSPFGACPECHGLGNIREIDPNLIIKDWNKTLKEGAMTVSGWNLDTGAIADNMFKALSKKYGFSLDVPVKDLPPNIMKLLLYGNDGEKLSMTYESSSRNVTYETAYEGIVPNLMRRYSATTSNYVKMDIEKYIKEVPCTLCNGKRLKKEALCVTISDMNIYEMCNMPINELYNFIDNIELNKRDALIAVQILKEIKARLKFLIDVGLSYLTLSRASGTLSGGESQRIRLATQIGSGLVGVLYILDEPSIGLHQRDNDKLLDTLKKLRDLGNTLIVVEHDEETIRAADFIVDIGPGAGTHGGTLVASGSVDDIIACRESITGKYLSGELSIPLPVERRKPNENFLEIIGARQNNLKNINVKIPVGLFTAITGVSGSGKSSLINGILYPFLAEKLNGSRQQEGAFDEIKGVQFFDKVIAIDQSPIGRTPRSNPATYTGVFTAIRDLFAATPDAKARGYTAGRFSFNVKGGRCENCSGDGLIKIEMHFLPDVYVPCEVCKGKRYSRETLEVKFKGKNISDVLNLTVEEACTFFENIPSIYNKIKTLFDVGLGYIKLGQPATTLSGGEAQRVKLATELSKRSTGKTIYILDEPTTGLSTFDISKLIEILMRLISGGNTVVIIEHNIEVIKVADYIIDLGPEGGKNGGEVVSCGSPEEVIKINNSYTGKYLKKYISK